MRNLNIPTKLPTKDVPKGDPRGLVAASEINTIVKGIEASELEGVAKSLVDEAKIITDQQLLSKADLIDEKVDPDQLPDIRFSGQYHIKEVITENGVQIERLTLNIENLKIALGLTGSVPQPAPPIWEFTSDRKLIATHVLGESEIVISSDGINYAPYAPIQVDDLAHLAGFRKAKTKASGSRPESDVAQSPEIAAKAVESGIVQQLVSTTNYNNHKYGMQGEAYENLSFFEVKKVLVSSKGFQFEFSNNSNAIIDEIAQDTLLDNIVNYRGSCEYNGVITPLLFNGLRDVVFEPGDIIKCDLIPDLTVLSGQDISLVHYITLPPGGAIPVNRVGVPELGEGYGEGPRNKDYTDGSTPSAIVLGPIFATTGVYATPLEANTDVALIVADSIGVGEGGAEPARSHYDLACMRSNIPSFNIGLRGDQAGYFNQPQYSTQRRKYLIPQKFTLGFCGKGTNDIQNGGDPTGQTTAALHIVHQYLAGLGMKVYQSTLIPKTSSSNNWIDLAGQEFLNREAIRNEVNTWIKTTPAPLEAFIDLNLVIEDQSRWVTDGTEFYATVDGVHPSQNGYEIMAEEVQSKVFNGTGVIQLQPLIIESSFQYNTGFAVELETGTIYRTGVDANAAFLKRVTPASIVAISQDYKFPYTHNGESATAAISCGVGVDPHYGGNDSIIIFRIQDQGSVRYRLNGEQEERNTGNILQPGAHVQARTDGELIHLEYANPGDDVWTEIANVSYSAVATLGFKIGAVGDRFGAYGLRITK